MFSATRREYLLFGHQVVDHVLDDFIGEVAVGGLDLLLILLVGGGS